LKKTTIASKTGRTFNSFFRSAVAALVRRGFVTADDADPSKYRLGAWGTRVSPEPAADTPPAAADPLAGLLHVLANLSAGGEDVDCTLTYGGRRLVLRVGAANTPAFGMPATAAGDRPAMEQDIPDVLAEAQTRLKAVTIAMKAGKHHESGHFKTAMARLKEVGRIVQPDPGDYRYALAPEAPAPESLPVEPAGPLSPCERAFFTLRVERDRRMFGDEIKGVLGEQQPSRFSDRTVDAEFASLQARGLVNNPKKGPDRGYGVTDHAAGESHSGPPPAPRF
jgi:hypothetical protein